MSFSEKLKAATWPLHREAEQCPFIQKLFRGQALEPEYLRYLEALLGVYHALDNSLKAHADDKRVGSFAYEALYREQALQSDVSFYAQRLKKTDDMTSDKMNPPDSSNYAARILEVASENTLLLVAHAYVRYLGDLSGGQMLSGIVRKSYELEGDEGTAFYQFSQIDDIKAFKHDFRQALDALVLTDMEEAALLEEAEQAFKFNIGLFQLI